MNHTVEIKDAAFIPPVVSIAVGDSVTWTNHDDMPHTVTDDPPGEFDQRLAPGTGTTTRTFPTAGTFPYHCQYHSFMQGTVKVA